MKKSLILLFALISTLTVFAQAPEKFSYQAIIRDSNKNLVQNTTVGVKLSIWRDTIATPQGTKVYEEIQNPKTNDNGLLTMQVGTGSVVSGNFSTIDWSNGPYFLKREIDITGGTNYNITGYTEMVSVPYSLYAKKVENFPSGAYVLSYTLPAITATNSPVTLLTTNQNWAGNRRILLSGYISLEFKIPAAAISNNCINGVCNVDFYLRYDGQTIMPINCKNVRIGNVHPDINNVHDNATITLPITALIPVSTTGNSKQFSIVCPTNESRTDAYFSPPSTTVGPYPIDVDATVVLSWIEL